MANTTGKKFGGRQAGTENKITSSLRKTVQAFLEANAADLQKQYSKLKAKDKLFFFERMLKYVMPMQTYNKIDFESMDEETLDMIIETLKANAKQ